MSGPSLVGRRLTLDCGAVAHGGHVVARDDDRVVFVRHALPGERVEAVVTKGRERDSYLFADADRILVAAPGRVEPRCPVSGPGGCGGCDFQHVDLEVQRSLKSDVVTEQLARLAGLDRRVEVAPLPGDEDGLRWRTRVEFAVGRDGRAGLRRHRSHDVVPLADCPIARREVVATGVLERRWPGLRALDVVEPGVGEPVVVPIRPKTPVDAPVVTERVTAGGHTYDVDVDARGFWQVHPGAATTFVTRVLDLLSPRGGERALDLYAGVGLFGRALADAVGPDGAVLAVETDERAVELGAAGAAGIDQLEFRAQPTHEALAPLLAGGDEVDLVVLDPPRSGAGRAVMADVLALGPRAVAYVACDPAALARDLRDVGEHGYVVAEIEAYDAFPMTHHVETIAVLRPGVADPAV
ncbi:class I SAM-dependent RNA methyltransferase [Agilicoccus flavus]|uniref:class I SAM-dependent RNA methyltransferase n=1 Tax=Agilicoccus flavus TaxID=2775968 RepID=UPI001CF6E2CC|nr:TRAM domain-containing protein [Agilicoccus flavus]